MTTRVEKERCVITAVAVVAGLLTQTTMAFGDPVASPYATGGEVTVTDLGNFKTRYVHVFTNTEEVATFRNVGKKPLSVRYLVVGGGGSGGYASAGTGSNYPTGGGGGGGGVYEVKDIPFAAGTEWSILVGKGAEPVVSKTKPGTTAGASSISNGTDSIVVVPGGGNGTRPSTNKKNVVNPTAGAAGGGFSSYATGSVGGKGEFESSIFGEIPEGAPFDGGGAGSKSYTGAGGGGAGSAGLASTNQRAGDGGDGLASDITGEALVYGSGGGGGANLGMGVVGGLGGMRAGNGATYEITGGGATTNFIAATAPAANSGCGGAGGMQDGGNDASTAGADGVVVIRYEVLESPCEGGDVVTRTELRPGKYRYLHVFTNTLAAAQFANRSGRELKLRYLVVGGGGSGGNSSTPVGGGKATASGGGGGGGGVCEVRDVQFATGAEWSILVGKGAKKVESLTKVGTAAGASSISNVTVAVAEAEVPGGGNGAKASTAKQNVVPATDGAAGGGGTTYTTSGGAGTYESSIFGVKPADAPFAGGEGGNYLGGGGGGAAAAGTMYTDSRAGDGGEGLVSDITGEELVYGSGGGGGAHTYYNRVGGLGGTRAGNGATYEITDGGATTNFFAATMPAANSGCGGAGGMQDGKCNVATDGADGVVIIRYDYAENQQGFVLIFR